MKLLTINPATEQVINEYACLNESEAEKQIQASYAEFLLWRQSSFAERSRLMMNLAKLLGEKLDELALIITTEMGKPITQARAEITKCISVCKYYAEHAAEFLQPQTVITEMTKAQVHYQPLGIILAVMPWNFPFWQVFRFAIPTLMAGNTVILKHAPISLAAGNAIAALFLEAEFPDHVFQHFIIDNTLTQKIIAHPLIAALSFTGSEKTGRLLASLAAANLKKNVLELGGNDPYLVLEDADLDIAAQAIVQSRLNNCGQVCIAAKRVIAVEAVYDGLVNKITELMADYAMGDPLNEETKMGPMARLDLRMSLHQQVELCLNQGAQLVLGGYVPDGPGFYYPPTLLINVEPGVPAFEEELFGPVIAMIKVKDEQTGIALANQSRYGLGGAVFTRDIQRGEHIALNEIQAGACYVNTFVTSDPRLPFGGTKCSGYGKELSKEGILEFVNVKTIAIK